MNLQNNNKKGQKKNSNYLGQITQNMGDKSTNKINLINEINLNSVDINKINLNAFLKRKDFEINSLEYEEAFNLDKRNYFQYYISLLKNNHPIMFSFSSYKDYNSRIIKMFLFFFSFSLNFTVNALFFSDETMHKIYQDKGEYNFLYQIPQIIYSTLISRFIDTLIKKFALSQDNIVELKQEKENNNVDRKYFKTLRILKIKFISFFVSTFIMLSFFWYYIICFCGIYENTQTHLIKDSVISLITSLLYPFAMDLIPGIFRILF